MKPRNIVHVHIPKTGGTWLNNILYGNAKEYFLGGEHLAVSGGVDTLSEWRPDAETCVDDAQCKVQLAISSPKYPGRWAAATKVSICRNPFDLLVSYYLHEEPHPTKSTINHGPHEGWAWAWTDTIRREGVPAGWDCINLTHGIRSFDEFIKKFCEIRFRWCHTLRRLHLFYQMFNQRGPCGVDIIMRNEMLERAAEIFLTECGYVEKGGKFHGKLERSNTTPGKKDYRSFYTDELRELVEKKCAPELALFEYNFDGPTSDDAFIDPAGLHAAWKVGTYMKNGELIADGTV